MVVEVSVEMTLVVIIVSAHVVIVLTTLEELASVSELSIAFSIDVIRYFCRRYR